MNRTDRATQVDSRLRRLDHVTASAGFLLVGSVVVLVAMRPWGVLEVGVEAVGIGLVGLSLAIYRLCRLPRIIVGRFGDRGVRS